MSKIIPAPIVPLLFMFIALLGFGTAFADAGVAPAGGDPLALYYPLIASVLGVVGATVRGYTPTTGFWHQWYGHAILTLLGFVLGGITPIFESGHVTQAALLSGAVGGVSAFLAAWKTKGKAGQDPKEDAKGGAHVFIPLAFGLAFGFLLPGCPGCTSVALPPAAKAYANAFLSCLQQRGIAAAPGVAEDVWSDLTNSVNAATIVAQLEKLAGKADIDAVTCAVNAWLNAPPPAEKNPAGVQAAKQFLIAHGARTKQ